MLTVIIFVDVEFLSDAACRRAEDSLWYGTFTYCFYGDGWNESTYISAVSGFYSTIIAVLIAIQALVSGLAFVFVRSTNRRAIEDEVEVQLPAYFGTVKAVDSMKIIVSDLSGGAIEQAITQRTAELESQLSELKESYYGLQGDYEELRSVVAELNGEELDRTEASAGEGLLRE